MRYNKSTLDGILNPGAVHPENITTMDTTIMTTTRAGGPGKNNLEARINAIMAAWEQQAPEAKFAGMTFADFRIAINPAIAGLQHKRQLRLEMKAAVRASAIVGVAGRALTDQVVASVKADSAYGPDSPLYRAMGFVPKSEIKRSRKQQQQPEQPTTATTTAAKIG
jgi:hypothetical protein